LVNPVMELFGPQTVALGKLSQAQPALPVVLHPSRTLAAAIRKLSVPIVFHPTTVASRADCRLDAPCLPLTTDVLRPLPCLNITQIGELLPECWKPLPSDAP